MFFQVSPPSPRSQRGSCGLTLRWTCCRARATWVAITGGDQKAHGMWYVAAQNVSPVARSRSRRKTTELNRRRLYSIGSVGGFQTRSRRQSPTNGPAAASAARRHRAGGGARGHRLVSERRSMDVPSTSYRAFGTAIPTPM